MLVDGRFFWQLFGAMVVMVGMGLIVWCMYNTLFERTGRRLRGTKDLARNARLSSTRLRPRDIKRVRCGPKPGRVLEIAYSWRVA